MNWHIVALDAHTKQGDLEGVVYTIHWSVTKQEGEHTASTIGTQTVGDPDPSSFTPIDDLDKDMVVGWLTEAMGEERLAEIEAELDGQIQDKMHPKTITIRPGW